MQPGDGSQARGIRRWRYPHPARNGRGYRRIPYIQEPSREALSPYLGRPHEAGLAAEVYTLSADPDDEKQQQIDDVADSDGSTCVALMVRPEPQS